MLPVLVATCCWIPALIGLGGFVASPLDEDLRPPVAAFAGLAVLAAFGMAANLLVALRPALAAAAFVLGWLAFLLRRTRLVPPSATRDLPRVALVLLAVAALTQFPAGGGKGYDTGLYHLQVVEWARSHRQPPGLASLYGPLGYDVSWFVVAALLEVPGLSGKGPFFLNGLPIVLAAWAAFAGLRRISRGERSLGAALLATLLVPACLAIGSLAFPGYDDPVTLLVLLGLALWALALERPGAEAVAPDAARDRRAALAFAATVLCALAVTIKLSAAPALGAALAGLVLVRHSLRPSRWLAIAAAGAALIVPWVARGIVMSGCLAYPAPASCLPVPWAVTPQNANGVMSAAVNFARAPPIEQASFLAPVARVLPYLAEGGRLPLLALIALTFVGGVAVARHHLRAAAAEGAFRFVVGVAIGGIVYWVATVPNPRFGVTYLLPLALAPLAVALRRGPEERAGRGARAVLAGACVLFALAAAGWTERRLTWADLVVLRWPAYPVARIEKRSTTSGFEVNVPVGSLQCWTAPLPCTPTFEADLAWRGMFVHER
jgi:hypothetical protein